MFQRLLLHLVYTLILQSIIQIMEKHVSQFNPSLQLSTTQSLVHSTHTAPQLDEVEQTHRLRWEQFDGNKIK